MLPSFPWITIWPDALFLTIKRALATASFCVGKNAPVSPLPWRFTAQPSPDGKTCTVLAICLVPIVPVNPPHRLSLVFRQRCSATLRADGAGIPSLRAPDPQFRHFSRHWGKLV